MKIQIKIVGLLSDRDEVHEIEKLAKIFVVEERMKDLTCNIEPRNIIDKTYSESSKKLNICQNLNHGYLPFLTVKGLN